MTANPSQIFLPASRMHTEWHTGAKLTTPHAPPSTPWALERCLNRLGNFSTPPRIYPQAPKPGFVLQWKKGGKMHCTMVMAKQPKPESMTQAHLQQGYHGSADLALQQDTAIFSEHTTKCTIIRAERISPLAVTYLSMWKVTANSGLEKCLVPVARGTQWCSVQTT